MGKGSKNIIDDVSNDTPELKKATETNGEKDPLKTFYKWSEVKLHNKSNDCWIVMNENVYNMTTFKNKHPGGSRIILHYGGQDATEAFGAFHKEFERISKYSKLYHIGRIDPNDSMTNIKKSSNTSINDSGDSKSELEKIIKESEMKKEFQNIKKIAHEMNLFKPSYVFFILYAFHIVFFQITGYYLLWNYGSSEGNFFPLLCSLICLLIAQGQSSWVQHDYGHLSVFSKSKFNRYVQIFFIGLIKGASCEWWRYLHNQHHAKPNVIGKDPDVGIDPVFLLGKTQPIKKAEKMAKNKEKFLYPYTIQHYVFPFAAPLLFPLFFQYTTIRHALRRKNRLDIAAIMLMFAIYFSVSLPAFEYNLSKSLAFYLIIRLIESSWFTWVSQCNHIVMDIHEDVNYDSWLHLQLKATCNLEKSAFNDWFTGHLNFQIEHHLFPTMPRHNLYKIQPLIQSLCKKYNINYVVKPMGRAFLDILCSLKKSGEMWQEAYDELILAT